jgi:hypothetical protein
MTSWTKPAEYPDRVVLEIPDQSLVFLRSEDDRYGAELDGERRSIRRVHQLSRVYEGLADRHSYEPERSEGDTADIDALLRCLELGAERKPLERGVELKAHDNWGHFRQHKFMTVAITIADDGAVEIDEDIHYQDQGYY